LGFVVVVCAAVSRAAAAETSNDIVARIAERYLIQKPKLRREDCSGLVNDVLRDAGAPDHAGGARHHWQRAQQDKRVAHDPIRRGDLVFFDRTYDSNRNGKVDDTLTHVAIVIDVLKDDTVIMAHRSSSKIEELRMNLRAPSAHMIDGEVANSFLRVPRYGPKDGPRFTGELYRGHARPPDAVNRKSVPSRSTAHAPEATTSTSR
jgi:hypothetical protein